MHVRLCQATLLCLLLLFTLPAAKGQGQTQATVSRSPHGDLKMPCENCHTFTSWKPLRNIIEFDHNKTRFPLRGLHAGVSCTQCHVSLVFTNVGSKCSDCHADIHRGQFGADCARCHTVRGWQIILQNVRGHENRFPLVGAHAALICDDCHKNAAAGQFQGLSIECIACHTPQFQQASFPNHQAAAFPVTCQQCHNMDSWQWATFDHLKFTGFALTGVHATLECSACHGSGNFHGLSTSCGSCHLKDFNSTTNPNHVQAGFPQDCAVCHNTSSWTAATFDHSRFTSFPLTGAHVSVPCVQCHVGGNFVGTPTACASCHLKDFQGTTNPNHVQGGFPTACQQCHNTTSWANATFDHSTTGFPLTGAHTTVQCAQCHVNNNYNLTSANAACSSCHMQDFQGTTNPNHVQSGFPTACQQCHNTTAWANATFDHSTTGFALTGAHTTVQCQQCHVNNNYNLTSANAACSSCHMPDYQRTTDPNHPAAGFPTDCSICHGTASWSGATFNHATTGFALTGAHTTLACQQCHVNNNYSLTSANAACFSCHQTDFNNTNNPSHVAAGFPTDCTVCHNTTSWAGATFNHNNTPFPLTGAHVTVPCNSCHINNVFAGTPTDCYSCHRVDYQGATNPNHVAAGFPTTCQTCHTTTSWAGATFNHTWFPMNHGNAAGICSTCHTNPSDFSVFQCTNCHTRQQTDPRHAGVRGYVYNSTNCYQCHPNGQGG